MQWELVFENKSFTQEEWYKEPRETRIDPLSPDGRYGALLFVRLISGSQVIWEVAIPEKATPICWKRRQTTIEGEDVGFIYNIGWAIKKLQYIIPINQSGQVGKAFFDMAS